MAPGPSLSRRCPHTRPKYFLRSCSFSGFGLRGEKSTNTPMGMATNGSANGQNQPNEASTPPAG